MNPTGLSSSLRKSYSNEPKKTLSFVDNDDDNHLSHSTDLETSKHVTVEDRSKSKIEKSVHFADEESVEEDSRSQDSRDSKTSQDIITWMPSEHLYSGDTFIDDSETELTTKRSSRDPATSIPTEYSYGSSTFVSLGADEENEEEDNTDTEPIHSYSDSFVSSDVFSNPSGTFTYKEWKDVTEIVKDIEELEESEFVTRADSLDVSLLEGDETDASETFDDEIYQAARQEFLAHTLQRLRLKKFQDPSHVVSYAGGPQFVGPKSKEERTFCRKRIEICRRKEDGKTSTADAPSPHALYSQQTKICSHPLELYGLNPVVVERLKLANLQQAMLKKAQDLDKETTKSLKFVEKSSADESITRDEFLAQMCSHVQRINMDDAIQSHLIKMHPTTQFAQFLSELPSAGEDVREILYHYKRQLENRMAERVEDIT